MRYQISEKSDKIAFLCLKLEIYQRQRQAEARHGSPSSASVDGPTNQVTCLKGCCNLSHQLLVDQSEASQRNSPLHVQYGWNIPRLVETEKHSLVQGTVHQDALRTPRCVSACLCRECKPDLPFAQPTLSLASTLQSIFFFAVHFATFYRVTGTHIAVARPLKKGTYNWRQTQNKS